MGDESRRHISVEVTLNETKPVRVTLQKVDEPPTRVEHRKHGRKMSDILRENEEYSRQNHAVVCPITEEEYQKVIEAVKTANPKKTSQEHEKKKESKALTDEEVRAMFETREFKLKPDRMAVKNSRASDRRRGMLRLIPGGLIGLNGPIND